MACAGVLGRSVRKHAELEKPGRVSRGVKPKPARWLSRVARSFTTLGHGGSERVRVTRRGDDTMVGVRVAPLRAEMLGERQRHSVMRCRTGVELREKRGVRELRLERNARAATAGRREARVGGHEAAGSRGVVAESRQEASDEGNDSSGVGRDICSTGRHDRRDRATRASIRWAAVDAARRRRNHPKPGGLPSAGSSTGLGPRKPGLTDRKSVV